MFYDKEIEIWKKGKKEKGNFGQDIIGEPKLVKTLKCDVQPYFSEEAQKDYGFTVECSKRIFMDLDTINIDTNFIRYKNKKYEIKKIIEWDDYMEVIIYYSPRQ